MSAINNNKELIREFTRAASRGNSRIVRDLLNNLGGDVDENVIRKAASKALYAAALRGHSDIVDQLLSLEGIDVNVLGTSFFGSTPLMVAARKGHSDVVNKLLLVEGIDVDVKNEKGETPLHKAAFNGNINIVERLLQVNGIDANAKDHNGNTPLQIALQGDHINAVEAFLTNGALVDRRDVDRYMPVFWAAAPNYDDIDRERLMQVIRDVGVNMRSGYAKNLLFGAAKHGDVGVLLSLLSARIIGNDDLNSKDHNGNTPLHWAAYYGRERMVNELINNINVRLDVRNNDSLTALNLAARQLSSTKLEKYRRIVDELESETSTLVDNNSLAGNLTQVRQRFRQ